MTLSDAGLSFSGTATLPVIGTVTNLQGSVQDASHFKLSVPVPSVTIGAFTLSSNTVTLADSGGSVGLSLTGNTSSLPVFGVVQFTGTIGADGTLGLSAKLPSFSMADGLASFQNDTLTLFKDRIHLESDVTIANVATAHFSGDLDSSGNYEFDAYVSSLTIAGFTIPVPNTGIPVLKLNNQGLQVGFSYDIPGLSSFLPADTPDDDGVSFSGSYSLTKGWSLTANASFTFDIGPFVVTNEIVTLTDDSLTVTGQGSVLDLGPLAAGKATLTIYNNATFSTSVSFDSTVAGLSLGQGTFTIEDDNATKTLDATFESVSSIPTGPTITFTGNWNSKKRYDFIGKGSYALGPFTLASTQFELSDMSGSPTFTFTAGLNLFSVLQGKASGTIVVAPDGSGFSVTNVTFDAAILGGPNVSFSGSFDSSGDYNFSGQEDLRVGPLTFDKTGFSFSNKTGALTYTDAWDYGIYSATVSGSFAAEGKGFVITADATGKILGQPVEISGSVHSSGAFDLIGHTGITIGPLTLTKATFELSNTSGFQISDSWDYLVFTGNATVTLDSDQSDPFQVNATLAVFGSSLGLSGTISPDGSTFDLTGSVGIKVGPISLASADFTLNKGGFGFDAAWDVLVFSGEIHASITSNSQGYVVTVANTSYLSVLGIDVNLNGVISTAPGQDSLSASANLSIGPFVLSTATFTLDDSGLSFDAGWNNLGFGGHVDASFGEDSHGGLIVQLGSGTELSILGQTLGLSGEIDSDGTYSFTGQMSLNAGPLDLGASTSFTLGNNGLTFGASWDFLGFKGGVGGGLLDDSSGYFIFIDRTKTYLSIPARPSTWGATSSHPPTTCTGPRRSRWPA